MPPRFMYWTILIDGKATAFRAREKDELLPTFGQLKRTNPAVVMKWFAHGKLWDSPDAERAARQRPVFTEKRGADWRPGGAHKDPRDRFKKKPADNQRPSWDGKHERPRKPWSAKPQQRGAGSWSDSRGPARKPWQNKPGGSRKPWQDKPGDSRKPWQDKPGGSRKPWHGKTGSSLRPWHNKPGASDKPWHDKRGAADRPWHEKREPSNKPWRDRRDAKPWQGREAGRSSDRWGSKPQNSGNPSPHRNRKPWEGSRRPPAKRRDDDPDNKK